MHDEGFKNLIVALVDNAVECAENPELSLGEEEFPTKRHKQNYLDELVQWAGDPNNEIINVYNELEDKPHRKIEYRHDVLRSVKVRAGIAKSEMMKTKPDKDAFKKFKEKMEEQDRKDHSVESSNEFYEA